MINDNDLKGAIVMVHPLMWENHADKAWVIGEITKVDISRDDFFVSYRGKQDHLHSSDAILILKPPEAIYNYLHQHAIDLTPQDFKDLKSTALLLDHGLERHKRAAM